MVSVMVEGIGESSGLRRSINVFAEAEIDHASVNLTLSEDEFAEVTVVSDQNAIFANSNRQDLRIGQTTWIIGGDPGGIQEPAAAEGHCVVRLHVHQRSGDGMREVADDGHEPVMAVRGQPPI